MTKYRPEIDGLRAIAVLAVIFYHAEIPYFKGGYSGVDVFFVISGYLISSILLSQKEAGNFTYKNFYLRRAKRILPILLVVLSVTIIVSWFILYANQLTDLANGIIAVLFFSGNIHFWNEVPYFSNQTKFSPIIHLWSLGVEEQFYFLFPALFVLFWKLPEKQRFQYFLFLCLSSLICALWLNNTSPKTSFYMVYTRGWELLAGVLITLWLNKKRSVPSIVSNILSVLGFILLIYSITIYTSFELLVTEKTILPVLSASLIILFSTDNNLIARLLSNRLLVGIGLISYSLYLWHQPIFAFARIYTKSQPTNLTFILLTFLSITLSIISFHIIEKPFRRTISTKKFIVFVLITSALLLLSCSTLSLFQGFPSREIELKTVNYLRKNSDRKNSLLFSNGLLAYKNYPYNFFFREKKDCHLNLTQNEFAEHCYEKSNASSDKPTIILWGDSLSASLRMGLFSNLENQSRAFYGVPSCPPTLGFKGRSSAEYCFETNQTVFEKIQTIPHPQVVLLANWGNYFNSSFFLEPFEAALSEFNKKNIPVYILGTLPKWSQNLPKILSEEITNKNLTQIPLRLSPTKLYEQRLVEKKLEKLALKHNANFISILDILCNEGSCITGIESDDGFTPFAFDRSHLTNSGSMYLGQTIQKLLAP